MSGILTRLVNRANGTAQPGLRLRLPSLFEAGTSDNDRDIATVREEVRASAAPGMPTDPEQPAPLGPTMATEEDVPQTHPVENREKVPSQLSNAEPPKPITTPPPQDQQDVTALPPVGSKDGQIESVDQIPDSPLQRDHTAAPVRAAVSEDNPLRSRPPTTLQPTSAQITPEPLLSSDPDLWTEPLMQTIVANRVAGPQHQSRISEIKSAPPDIEIHIGRIDLRSEAAKPVARRKKPAESRPMTSLSDYLKGAAS